MTIRDIVKKLGGDREVAQAIGLRPTAVRAWIFNGYVPPKHHDRITELAADAGFTVSATDLDPAPPTG